jgi:hypothetical protein
MKKSLVGLLAVGFMATAANAATLSMRFAGGATEITMAGPSDSVTIEVLLTFSANGFDNSTKTPSRTSGINARFEVGDLADAGFGPYIEDDFGQPDAGKWVVTETTTPVAGWNTLGSSAAGAAFDSSYFFAAEDPTGVVRLSGNPAATFVLGSFTIHKQVFSAGDTYIAFRVGAALPAVAEGASPWTSRFQYTTQAARNQWLMNDGTVAGGLPGNPGDGSPGFAFHGYETLNPLIIHNVPEPSALALLALGGLAMLRRRN